MINKDDYVRVLQIVTKDEPFVWQTVKEVNLGSLRIPNDNIKQVKFIMIKKNEYQNLKDRGLI